LNYGLVTGLIVVLFSAVGNAFFGGLQRGILDTKGVPNLGIKLSIRNALVAGGIGLAVFVPLAEILWGLYFGLGDFLEKGLLTWKVSSGAASGITWRAVFRNLIWANCVLRVRWPGRH
jgi:hypothetical protein